MYTQVRFPHSSVLAILRNVRLVGCVRMLSGNGPLHIYKNIYNDTDDLLMIVGSTYVRLSQQKSRGDKEILARSRHSL